MEKVYGPSIQLSDNEDPVNRPTFRRDSPRFTAVQALHALDLRESHKVAILQPVSRLVQAGHHRILALFISFRIVTRPSAADLLNVNDHPRLRVLSRRVDASEITAKVVEHRSDVNAIHTSTSKLTRTNPGRRQR